MNDTMKALALKISAKRQEADALLSAETVTPENLAKAEGLVGEVEALRKQYDLLEKTAGTADWEGSRAPAAPVAATTHPDAATLAATLKDSTSGGGVHYERKRKDFGLHGRVTSFHGDTEDEAVEKAYRFGLWFCGVAGNTEAQAKCADLGIVKARGDFAGSRFKAQNEGTNSAGGALVPIEFVPDLIRLVEQYGAFRRNARIFPMSSDTLLVPRRTGGLTVYYPGEAGTITDSSLAVDNVELKATKMATLTKTSTELVEDSAVDIGNMIAFEIALAFAKAEDSNGFLGDGTSTYGGMVGLAGRFAGLGTEANSGGVQTLTASGWTAHVLTDFEGMVGKLPVYADNDDVKWYCHKTFFHTVMMKLALASGGVPAWEVIDGVRKPMFLGYPVEFAQIMPKATGTQYSCYLGNLRMAAAFGDRRQMAIATSEHANFTTDELAVRATQRIDINVHDVGTNSATASLQVAGPIIAGYTA